MSEADEEKDLETLDQATQLLKQTREFRLLIEKLKPLMESILSSSEKKNMLQNFLGQSRGRFEKSAQRLRLFKEDSKADYGSQLNTLRKAFLFLALFETTVTNIVNCMVFMLMLNGHDIFMPYHRKYAESFDDLDKLFLAEKLDFLNFHGFSFFTEHINRSLRNKIAHMDFDIEGKGVIIWEGQKYNLQTELTKLEAILLLATKALSNAGFVYPINEDS